MEPDLLSLGILTFLIPPGRVPCDENECVGLIRGGSCLHFLLLTPAYSSQIVLRTAYDYFAPQEVILV